MKILLPLDGSERSETALQAIERFGESEVLLLKVTEHYGMLSPELPAEVGLQMQERAQARSQNYLDSLARRLGSAKVRTATTLGWPRDEIVRVAKREKCDLIVMNSHQHDGLVRWMLGSVAEGVLRTAPCPVLLLRPEPVSSPPPPGFRHVVVPVDGSAASIEVLRRLPPFLLPESRVTLLRSSTLTTYPFLPPFSAEEAEHYCQELERELRQIEVPGLSPEVVVLEGDPVECILAWTKGHDCDLIAMSTHGRSGFRRFWMGSVTEKVARHAECAVLAFRLPRVQDPAPAARPRLLSSRV